MPGVTDAVLAQLVTKRRCVGFSYKFHPSACNAISDKNFQRKKGDNGQNLKILFTFEDISVISVFRLNPKQIFASQY